MAKTGFDIVNDIIERDAEAELESYELEEPEDSEEVEHHGVKGMKWGVRKKRGSSSSSSKSDSDKSSNLKPKSEKTKTKNMTNAELQAKLNRIKMERELAQLLSTPKKQSQGKAIVTKILTDSATQVGTELVKSSVQLGVKTILTKKFGEALAKSIVK